MEIITQLPLSDIYTLCRTQRDPVSFAKNCLQEIAAGFDDVCRAEMDARTQALKVMRSDAKVLRISFDG